MPYDTSEQLEKFEIKLSDADFQKELVIHK